jgi:hypothetical protein
MMKIPVFFLGVLYLFSSCQFFETEKISSEKFYEEELKTISWNEIDQYPTFSRCNDITEKIDQRDCFVNTLSGLLLESIKEQKWTSMKTVEDTLVMDITVSNTGEIQIERIDMDSITGAHFPNMTQVLSNSLKSQTLMSPAYKRGIPVNTRFTLPIALHTE